MKLLTKTSLNQFWLSIIIIVITGIMLLFLLQREVSVEIEEQLEMQAAAIVHEIEAGRPVNSPMIQIISDDSPMLDQPRIFRDTLIFDQLQQKTEGYYYLTDNYIIKGQEYRIRVMTSHIGIDGYSKAIIYIFIIMALLLIICGSVMNYFVNRKIWQPFLTNLQRLKSYSVSSTEQLTLDRSNIHEFEEMNTVLIELAEKARAEYIALKEFTANASHEIQTPLSIIQSGLESISQFELQPEIAGYVVNAKEATSRLSKVNKSLLLLAKLENNDFPDKKKVDLSALLNEQIDRAEDLFSFKGLQLERQITYKEVYSSLFLLEVLISNLLSNIVAHAGQGTQVKISLTDAAMTFENGGEALTFPEGQLFARFGKGTDSNKGNGLGLSIVKQICLANGWEVKYHYADKMHVFKVFF
ncbi:sensor histidine kinase [Daejeonella lutea]|uniref:histidine kinase n=1 Tax=Daejeonella lutea TaxID=572036 RepID=A0A1T5AYQ7_9SPHI|nr:HAMP domain-containing sensor histidine kinase [Daejeonella lutea]SKB39959.1 Signal transduction histidine kinase [Daejeonella lutea]